MIADPSRSAIEKHDFNNKWFQQDMALLSEQFPGRVISQLFDVNWPLGLCDLTLSDFFCGAANKPFTLEYLKTNIREVMVKTPPNMGHKVVEKCQVSNFIMKRECHGENLF